jgi:hypothetical protein
MDVIKSIAKDFREEMYDYANSLEKFDTELNSKLLYINKDSEKLRFLSYLKDMVESDYQDHIKVCRDPDDCQLNKGFEIAIYSIKQQFEDYSKTAGVVKDFAERPAMQFFSEGKYFDAFTAIKECIKEAKESIILIDNFVDSDTLAFFPGKEPSIKLRILTTQKNITEAFQRTIDLYNKQYENLVIQYTKNYYDRFLILDELSFYHIGASIKDAGNKTFMFSKIEDDDIKATIMEKIKKEWNDVL